jgi:hypothetical protein
MYVETKLELITPETAKEYLATSRGNRTLRRVWVLQLARDMTAKRFKLTHESIGFLEDGSLFDGHHRLEAVVLSGESVYMRVTRGVKADCVNAVDRGRGRSTTDAYQIAGEKWFTRQVAAIGRMWMILLGKRNPTDAELFEFCQENRLHIESARIGCAGSAKSIYSHACVLTMLAVGMKAGKQDSLEGWYKCFSTGIATEEYQTSAICLREWWIRGDNRMGGTDRRERMCRRIYGSMRAWCERRKISKSIEASAIDWLEDAESK